LREDHRDLTTTDPEGNDTDLTALLARARRGDGAACAALYDATAARVYGLVLRVVGTETEALAVTERVYGDIWSERHETVSGSSIAWILAIAHRVAVTTVRAARESGDVHDPVGDAGPVDALESTVGGVGLSREGRRVAAALAELTGEQREALTLAYFGAHTHSEVSMMTGSPQASTHARLHDGLALLRDHLVGG
jgi:RNA polymerase sigma-70 factor (ECF subfamily)